MILITCKSFQTVRDCTSYQVGAPHRRLLLEEKDMFFLYCTRNNPRGKKLFPTYADALLWATNHRVESFEIGQTNDH